MPSPWICLLAAFAFGNCARGTIKIPASDTTPPRAMLNVSGPGNSWALTAGHEPVSVALESGDSLVLTAVGEDLDGGVKDVWVGGKAVAECRDALSGEQRIRSGSFQRRIVFQGRPGSRATGSKTARLVLRVSDFRRLCDGASAGRGALASGGASGLVTLRGAAGVRTVNFHGASATTATLEFRFAAPPLPAKVPAVRHPNQAG